MAEATATAMSGWCPRTCPSKGSRLWEGALEAATACGPRWSSGQRTSSGGSKLCSRNRVTTSGRGGRRAATTIATTIATTEVTTAAITAAEEKATGKRQATLATAGKKPHHPAPAATTRNLRRAPPPRLLLLLWCCNRRRRRQSSWRRWWGRRCFPRLPTWRSAPRAKRRKESCAGRRGSNCW